MNEVIGYVDARAEEVAAAKADDVLEPAEQAKDDAIAAKEAAEQARDTTLAALPQIQQDITDLKAEDVALDGRLDNVELRITTAEGNIVTIQGRVTAVENKNTQQDSAIAALQTADANNVKITGANAIGNYAVLLTDNQTKNGVLTMNTGINGIKFPVCDKIPENTGNKYIKLFSITKRASMLVFTVKTPSQYMTVLADIRTNIVSIRTEIHGTTPDRFANTDIIVMGDDAKYYFFMKYPQNRKFVLDFDNVNPLFENGTYAFADIDKSFFDRTLVDEPEVGAEYTSKYQSGAM